MNPKSRFATPVIGAALALALAACNFSVGSKEVSADELAEQVKVALTESVGQEPDQIDCDDPLPAEEGSTVRCVLTHGGSRIGVTVTSQGLEDDKIRFDAVVDDEPMD